MIKKSEKIMVFTYGDADSAKTWSNVPYFLTRTLENKGYNVVKVNTRKCYLLQRCVDKIIHMFFKNTEMAFAFTKLNERIVSRVSARAMKKNHDAKLVIVTNFSYLPSCLNNKKTLIFSDWTFEYLIRDMKKRSPSKLESRVIKRQTEVIKKADVVVSLFHIAEDMKIKYNKNIYYLGNVINIDDDIKSKQTQKDIHKNRVLFIGQKKYVKSLEKIIMAINEIEKTGLEVKLDVIGMCEEDVDNISTKNVQFYGYLDKTLDIQKEKYYNLINNAKICINTSEGWGGFSSIIECMYLNTPIITSRYSEFEETFGKCIDFGFYCEKNDKNEITKLITKILKMDEKDYKNMSDNAYRAVKDFTWDRYVDKMLELV